MKKIIAVMIVVFVVVFSCLFIIITKKNYSENENRYIAKISKISFKKILSCEFLIIFHFVIFYLGKRINYIIIWECTELMTFIIQRIII